jgi:hypothetical protein
VYFATGSVDMRKGIVGLCGVVEATLRNREEPPRPWVR